MSDANQTTFIEHFQRCLFLFVLTIASNLFLSVPLIGEAEVVFGSVFVLLSLIILPYKFFLVVFAGSILSHYLIGYGWIFLLTHALEVLVIAVLINRHVFIMMASIGFWLCIGMPLLWILATYSPTYLQEVNLLIAIQKGLIGILCAALAASIIAIVPNHYKQPQFNTREYNLSINIFSICASVLVVPVLIISFIFISVSSRENESLMVEKIEANTSFVAQLTKSFIDEHKLIIEQVASLLSDQTPTENVHSFMLESQIKHPSFFNLTTTDADGGLLFFAPEKFNAQIARLPPELRTVSDRYYFNAARNSGETYISNTILSRGVIVAPMVSIASPIIQDDEFAGIIFGAINLDAIKTFRNRIEQLLDGDLVIITDASNQTIYASQPIKIDPLEVFLPMPSYNYIISQLPVLTYENRHYAYHKKQTPYGWKVYVLTESASLTEHIRNNFVIAGLSLFLVIAVFLLFAYKLSRQISAPLKALLESEDNSVETASAFANSKEFSAVANKLKRSQFLMKNFENRLKQQVTEKTEQLEQLNLQLAAQAREDGMTHLLNRSGFDEMAINAIKTSYRLGQPFSMALLDIDHFKKINDTHGHLFGDKCLQAFSALMQRNCKRETDIIGRYGGEEFIIFMAGKNVQAHHQLMQNIHQQTQKIRLKPADTSDSVSFTVSIGICSVLGNLNLSMQEIVKLADEELYKCKGSGRDRISLVTVGYTHNDA
ncbi:diguanylate cyclase [Glaciecola sp. SC05]|uniref:diguanylate cyclase n=1 Tax=Glaciecola sp. SC05 TaxID=1987355 RepID=UPI00352879EB